METRYIPIQPPAVPASLPTWMPPPGGEMPPAQPTRSLAFTPDGYLANPSLFQTLPESIPTWPDTYTSQSAASIPEQPSINEPKTHEDHPFRLPDTLKHLGLAAGAFALGLLLKRLPSYGSSYAFIPTDWKDYAKIAAGITAANQVNKGLDVQPPAWGRALEAVALINPLISGISTKSFRQLLVLGPVVAVVVEGATRLNQWVTKRLTQNQAEKDHHQNMGIPTWLPRLAIFAGMTTLGLTLYPKLFKTLAKAGWMGKEAKQQFSQDAKALLGSSVIVCARGCCQGSVICLSELGEMIGGLGVFGTHKNATATPTPQQHHHPVAPLVFQGTPPRFGHTDSCADGSCALPAKKAGSSSGKATNKPASNSGHKHDHNHDHDHHDHTHGRQPLPLPKTFSGWVGYVLKLPFLVIGELFESFFKDLGVLFKPDTPHHHDHHGHDHDHSHGNKKAPPSKKP